MLIFNKDKVGFSLILFFVTTSAILLYLVIQMMRADIGANLANRQSTLSSTMAEYERTKSELSNYEGKIRALSPETLDKDFLEEQAREKLLYTKKNEVVIFKD